MQKSPYYGASSFYEISKFREYVQFWEKSSFQG